MIQINRYAIIRDAGSINSDQVATDKVFRVPVNSLALTLFLRERGP